MARNFKECIQSTNNSLKWHANIGTLRGSTQGSSLTSSMRRRRPNSGPRLDGIVI